jgi:glycosyltransferase involved in cell wall biosynthesis
LYRRAAAVVSVTNAFKANLTKRGIDPAKIGVVTNGADLTRFAPMPRDAELASKYGLDGKTVAGYVGTHGMAHGLETLLETAQALKREGNPHRIHLIFLGDGASKKALVEKAHVMGLDNVTFIDTVPKDQVARYWSLLDISIIHLKADPLFETVIPSKLFECMAMGLPVLHGVKGESAGIVERDGAGLVFEPGDAMALKTALERLAADPDARAAIARRARAAAANYDRRALAAAMLRMLESVARTGALPAVTESPRP